MKNAEEFALLTRGPGNEEHRSVRSSRTIEMMEFTVEMKETRIVVDI